MICYFDWIGGVPFFPLLQSAWFWYSETPNYIYFDIGGEQSLISKRKSELESLEVQICGEIHHFSPKKKIENWIEKFFT